MGVGGFFKKNAKFAVKVIKCCLHALAREHPSLGGLSSQVQHFIDKLIWR